MDNSYKIKQIMQQLGTAQIEENELDVYTQLSLLPGNDIFNENLHTLKKVLDERKTNRNQYCDINIVSLGENCIGRTIPTRWGLINTKKNGRKTMVFDLAIHRGHAVENLLTLNFKDYLNKDYLFFNRSDKMWRHKKYNVLFNHDKDILEDEIDKLTYRYLKRIENFYQALTKDNLILLFSIIHSNNDVNINHLFDLVKAIRKNSNFYLVVCNHLNDKFNCVSNYKNIFFTESGFPQNNYKWWMPEFYLSQEGYKFEKDYIDNLKVVISNMRHIHS